MDDEYQIGGIGVLCTRQATLAEKVGFVKFTSMDHGNSLTSNGRDVAAAGLAGVWREIFNIPAGELTSRWIGVVAASVPALTVRRSHIVSPPDRSLPGTGARPLAP